MQGHDLITKPHAHYAFNINRDSARSEFISSSTYTTLEANHNSSVSLLHIIYFIQEVI